MPALLGVTSLVLLIDALVFPVWRGRLLALSLLVALTALYLET